jgi:prepilin-type N-terminal cleavage/methylation domain-containing protein
MFNYLKENNQLRKIENIQPHQLKNSCSIFIPVRFITKYRTGFSLMELMVVISIISLLLGVTIPTLHTVKEKARSLQCLLNLRSIGSGLRMYADDNCEAFPRVTNTNQTPIEFMNALSPYLGSKKTFICPRDPNKPVQEGGSYDWRYTDDPNCSLSRKKLNQIHYPCLVALGGDRYPSWHKRNFINVLFADMHVEQISEENWFKGIKSPLNW